MCKNEIRTLPNPLGHTVSGELKDEVRAFRYDTRFLSSIFFKMVMKKKLIM